MRWVVVDDATDGPELSTYDDYILSYSAPRPHKQTTPSTTHTRNGPVAPQYLYTRVIEYPPIKACNRFKASLSREYAGQVISFQILFFSQFRRGRCCGATVTGARYDQNRKDKTN